MTGLLRFSPSRLALGYVALSVFVLGLFAIPLWYMWGVNLGTFRAYVEARDVDEIARTFERDGPQAAASAIDSRVRSMPRDQIVVLADPAKTRIAGNLAAWPAVVPDSAGTYGLVIGGDSSTRVVVSHVVLPGGYHLLVGRESARFQSLVDYFWFGIAAAVAIALLLGAGIGWLVRRALLFEVRQMSRTAAAIVEGDLSRRLPARSGSGELDSLARIVNGMLEQLHRAHGDLEQLVAKRTEELAEANESLRRSEARFALAVDAAGDGFSDWIVATDDFYASPRLLEMCGLPAETKFNGRADFLARFPFHPEDRERVIGAINRHLSTTTVRLEQEMRILRRGEARSLRLTGLCSRDPAGALVRWTAATTDVTERKLASEALRASERRYALAMEASGEGHWDWNIETDDYYASPRMLELCGFAPGTRFAGRTDFRARFPFHPEDRAKWERAVAAHFAGETARFDIEIRMVPRGETRWIHLTGLLSRDPSGKPLRWTGAVADITARRCVEEALRLSEHRYALAMEATGDGHWDWDVAADKFYASPLLLEICGFATDTVFDSRAQWQARFPIHPDDRLAIEEAIVAHFEGRTARLDMEMRIVPRGETRWIHLMGLCLRHSDGAPLRWAGSVTDVTARKRVEDELRARQDMLDLAQKAARAVAFEWRIGAGEGENRWSPDLEAMYGVAPGSYDGTYEAWKRLVYAEDWPAVRTAIIAAQATGDVDAEYRVMHTGGVLRWLQAKGRMFFDPDGKPTRLVGFMLDVTDRHVAYEELRRMERQLRQAQRLESMGTMAGGIAHDFNNLLGAILGYGEMALRDAPAGSRLRRDLDNIMIAGERSRALVDRILAFSRSGVGERVPVDVEAVARETLRIGASKLPEGIRVQTRLHAQRAAVLGDATQIHQVLMNLVTNAMQAMPSGGTLSVALDAVQVDAARIATTGTVAPGPYVVMAVTDTGSGIAPEIIERIFDPFFTTKDVGVGTGLGLSLVHGIVTALGGAIDVVTEVGRGSAFNVYLPRAEEIAAAGAMRKRARPALRPGARQQVLVVDDEEALVTLTNDRLRDLGYLPAGFTSSAAAMAAFISDPSRFDAVITDESMPGASGSDLIRQMRALRPTLPVVLMSGYLSADVIRRAREAGADEVLKKPVSAGELASTLERILRPASSRPTTDGQSARRNRTA